MDQIAALSILVSSALEQHSPTLIETMQSWAGIDLPNEGTIYIEIQVAALTDSVPVHAFYDGPTAVPDFVTPNFGRTPLLTQAQEDAFILWEDGPYGPQHALEQPVIDVAEVENSIILPWVMSCWNAAGRPQLPCEVVTGLHDSADWTVLNPASPPPEKGFFARLFGRS